MEEILASIRRIIADDDASKSAARPPGAAEGGRASAGPAAIIAPGAGRQCGTRRNVRGVQRHGRRRGAILRHPRSYGIDGDVHAQGGCTRRTRALRCDAQVRKIDGHADVSFDESAEKSPAGLEASRPHLESEAAARGEAERAQLLSRETSAAVDSAFNTLAQTVLVQNARTLEDLVREMLRPMLKTWLDDNLPGMVERLVRAEIERVSRGRVG